MVEVKLDPVDPFFADKNTYVSMRVGEVQKLGRASTSRVYTFPSKVVGDRKYGKIDIFKRVGTCTVGILPESDLDQMVNIPLDDQTNAMFKVALRSTEKPAPPSVEAPSTEKKPADVNPKVLAAKTYLEKHRLELRLSEAMQEVIRLEPEDPCAYIADKLTKPSSTVSYLPKEQPPLPERMEKPTDEVQPPKSVPAPSPEPPKEAPVNLENLGDVALQKSAELSRPGTTDFIAESPVARKSDQATLDMLASAAYWDRPFHLRPSTNTWMRRRLRAPKDIVISNVTTVVVPITPRLSELATAIPTTGSDNLRAALAGVNVAQQRRLEQYLLEVNNPVAIQEQVTEPEQLSKELEAKQASALQLGYDGKINLSYKGAAEEKPGRFAERIAAATDAELLACFQNVSATVRIRLQQILAGMEDPVEPAAQ